MGKNAKLKSGKKRIRKSGKNRKGGNLELRNSGEEKVGAKQGWIAISERDAVGAPGESGTQEKSGEGAVRIWGEKRLMI